MKILIKLSFTQFLLIICLSMYIMSCNQNKTNTKSAKTTIQEEAKKVSKQKKQDKTNRNTTVRVDAKIDGETFSFGEVNIKQSNDVVFAKGEVSLNFIDDKGQVIMVGLFSEDIFDTTPVTFTQQIAALPPKEQYATTIKRSRVHIRIPGELPKEADAKLLYDGKVALQKLTGDEIIVEFEGRGFEKGEEPQNSRKFPMNGKVIVKNYTLYDAR